MTYNVLMGTLNPTHSSRCAHILCSRQSILRCAVCVANCDECDKTALDCQFLKWRFASMT